jgi:hypothetical protein
MRLDRRRLRRLIKEEYRKVLREMNYGAGGSMYRPTAGMDANHPDYDLLGNVIQTATMNCMMQGIRSSNPEGVRTCCMNACANHDVMHHLDYVCEKVMNMLQMSGM